MNLLRSSSSVNRCRALIHVGGVDDDTSGFHVGGFEAEILEHAFQDRVEPAGPDVLRRLIDLVGMSGQRFDGRRR